MHSIACCCGTITTCHSSPATSVCYAYWNKFGIPDKQPNYNGPDIDSWWIDVEKEKVLAAKYKGAN